MRDDEDDEVEREFQRCQRAASVHPGRVKPRRARDQFVMVPLRWAEQACRATSTPKAFVWLWLLHLAWKEKSNTFPLPNGPLRAYGVNRKAKERALRELEAAGLISVVRRERKTPVVTLICDKSGHALRQIGT